MAHRCVAATIRVGSVGPRLRFAVAKRVEEAGRGSPAVINRDHHASLLVAGFHVPVSLNHLFQRIGPVFLSATVRLLVDVTIERCAAPGQGTSQLLDHPIHHSWKDPKLWPLGHPLTSETGVQPLGA